MNVRVTARTKIAAVVGRPIAHSLSPRIHNAWIASAGLDAVYIALSPTTDRFEKLIEGLRGSGFVGVNVTAPFKERALALADEADAFAMSAGAANVIAFKDDGRATAHNFDGVGFLSAFRDSVPQWRPDSGMTIVLGAGGAARGAVAALTSAGGRVCVANRSLVRAKDIANTFHNVEPMRLEDAHLRCGEAVAIVNAISGDAEIGVAMSRMIDALPPGSAVMDMSYTPLRTPFLQLASRRGLSVVEGLSMLIGQARPSFEVFFRQPPPHVDVRALLERSEARA